MNRPPATLQFPYMVYAHQESFVSPYSLSQSGMPLPDTSFLDGTAIDAGHPSAEALPEFEAKVARLFNVAPERVLATVGASAAMLLCAMRWFRHGATVVCESPSYEPLRRLPAYLGAQRVLMPRSPDRAWAVDSELIDRALDGASPGHVFLTNPNNPTGALADRKTMQRAARAAEAASGVLVCCEVYADYLPNEKRVHAFDLAPNGVTIGSLTKAYGLGGLRAGWIILGEELIEERDHLRDMSYLGYVDPPTASLRGANLALENLPQLLQPLRQVEHHSRPHWERWLRETEGVEALIPDHGIIAFPKLDGVEDTLSFASYLAREHQVDVVPGEYFGMAGHIRLGCGVPEETLVEGLKRLTAGIEAWRSGEGRDEG